jgi:hypothetical protein
VQWCSYPHSAQPCRPPGTARSHWDSCRKTRRRQATPSRTVSTKTTQAQCNTHTPTHLTAAGSARPSSSTHSELLGGVPSSACRGMGVQQQFQCSNRNLPTCGSCATPHINQLSPVPARATSDDGHAHAGSAHEHVCAHVRQCIPCHYHTLCCRRSRSQPRSWCTTHRQLGCRHCPHTWACIARCSPARASSAPLCCRSSRSDCSSCPADKSRAWARTAAP